MFVLPIVLDGILGIEPRSIKHLIYIVVIPLLHLIQFVLDDIHPVDDEEHMKLWIALKVVVYSILYHNFINTSIIFVSHPLEPEDRKYTVSVCSYILPF